MPPLRVLQVTSTARIGGAEQLLLRFLSKADPSRADVSVATMEPEGPFLEALASLGVQTFPLPAPNPLHPGTRGALAGVLRQSRFDVVHAHGLRAEVLARGLAAGGGVRAYVSAIHSPDPWRRPWHVWLDRWTARGGRVDLYVSVSEVGRRSRIEREGVAPEKIVVVPNAVDAEALRPEAAPGEAAAVRRRFGLAPDDGPLVVIVSNLRPMKGHLEALAATAHLAREFPGIRLLLAGSDTGEVALGEAMARLGIEDRVVLCGFVEEPWDLMRTADLFAMPSHWEGSPSALLEAMALARPIVTTTGGGIPEIVRDGREALLTPPGDARALAEAMGRLLRDRELGAHLGAAARQRILQQYTLADMTRRLQDIYERLIADAEPG